MYIAINRENMTFMNKHEQHDVLCNLAWIEAQDAALHVIPLDIEGFECFTNMEMMLLMGNGHAPEFVKSWSRTRLIAELVTKLNMETEVDVWPFELASQAKHVPENATNYQYVKGANRAVKLDKLFS